ncbi:MAG: hypothetical protein ACEQSX_12535 [Baekduiaceae bacterium]
MLASAARIRAADQGDLVDLGHVSPTAFAALVRLLGGEPQTVGGEHGTARFEVMWAERDGLRFYVQACADDASVAMVASQIEAAP